MFPSREWKADYIQCFRNRTMDIKKCPVGKYFHPHKLTCEKDVDPGEWFFKAHFFQDPVQPGSLGIEAMIQVLQWYMIDQGLGKGYAQPRFTCLGLKQSMQWKYRGQVIPENKVITTTMDILEVGKDEVGVFARANASLWVDGKRIYEAIDMRMHIVEG